MSSNKLTIGLWTFSRLGKLFGLRTLHRYMDIEWRSGALRLFVAQNREGDYDYTRWTDRTWYRLTLRGWVVVRREDRFGLWSHGKHTPPLLSVPPQGIPQRAWELRRKFEPYQMIDWYGQKMEVISFPSPEKDRVTLMIRKLNDPTTLQEVTLEEYMTEAA